MSSGSRSRTRLPAVKQNESSAGMVLILFGSVLGLAGVVGLVVLLQEMSDEYDTVQKWLAALGALTVVGLGFVTISVGRLLDEFMERVPRREEAAASPEASGGSRGTATHPG